MSQVIILRGFEKEHTVKVFQLEEFDVNNDFM